MKVHVHKLRDDGTHQCLSSGEIGPGRVAELTFEPEDVTEPWTIIVSRDEDDIAGETVLVTVATAEQVRRHKLGARADAPEALFERGGAGGSFVRVDDGGEQ